ncbi:MAG: 4-hydroxybutyrate dehydrogenase [Lachnospiraceae bacterium]|nr:4-hydroxybutyrate dehydrogenase [Lachnospiraceae bacterium]
MSSFSIHPVIEQYESFEDYAAVAKLCEKDLLFTNEFIYEPFMKAYAGETKVLFQERYGRGEPSDEMMDAIRKDMPEGIERIIAVGGGTVIDIAKILSHGGDWAVEDLYLGKVVAPKVHELVVIPTTCGTGSEMTNVAVSALVKQNTKKGLALDSMYPDRAVLIPEMVKTLPYKFFATSSIDAMIHAAESYLSPKANAFTEMFSERALELILSGYRFLEAEGTEKWTERAGDFLLASNYAGIAFGNAGVGAVHALSYPLGGAYHIPHGESNMLMFSEVFRKYKEKKPVGKINQLEEMLGRILGVPAEASLDALADLLNVVLPLNKLHEYGVKESDLPVFTESVITGQQRLLNNNYVELTAEDMMAIYTARF